MSLKIGQRYSCKVVNWYIYNERIGSEKYLHRSQEGSNARESMVRIKHRAGLTRACSLPVSDDDTQVGHNLRPQICRALQLLLMAILPLEVNRVGGSQHDLNSTVKDHSQRK